MPGALPDLPLLIGVGPIRAGTTWVHELLFNHSQVATTLEKESHFFLDDHFHKGEAWYLAQFEPVGPQTKLMADLSPHYILNPASLERIKATVPNPLVLVSLRSPYERALSWWSRYGEREWPPGTSPASEPLISAKMARLTVMAAALERCIALFGDRVIYADFDELKSNPREFAKSFQERLGLKVEMSQTVDQRVNSAAKHRSPTLTKVVHSVTPLVRKMSPKLLSALRYGPLQKVVFTEKGPGLSAEEKLKAYDSLRTWLEPDIDRLEQTLQRDLSHWRHPRPGE